MQRDIMPFVEATIAFHNISRRALLSHRLGLSKSQVDVMLGLHFLGPMSMGEVSDHLAMSKEQASRAVSPLVAQGLVDRKRSERAYRMFIVSLSEEGESLMDELLDGVLMDLRDVIGHLQDDDVAELMVLCRSTLDILDKVVERKRRDLYGG